MIWVLNREHGRFPLGEGALPLLRSLLPSFRAGLHALDRLGAQRMAEGRGGIKG